MNKPKILILTDWYLPAVNAGGPVKSVSSIVEAIKDDYSISIITSDRDFGSAQIFENVKSDQWIEKDGYRILYSSPFLSKDHIVSALKEKYQKIYLNSLFSKNFTLTPLRIMGKENKQKVILAPRGMLGEGALSLKSFKKKTFLHVAKLVRLYNGVLWHASSPFEEREIKNHFPRARVKVLENLSQIRISTKTRLAKKKNHLKLVFVSRISPKKNLLFALQLIKDKKGVEMDIYGPVEDLHYWKQCEQIIQISTSKIQYCGVLPQEHLTHTLENYHVFVLPTLNENFGHVILEAFGAGLPVLISDQTPWKDLEGRHLGKDLTLQNPELWCRELDLFLKMNTEQYQLYRQAALSYAEEKTKQKNLVVEYKKLFGV